MEYQAVEGVDLLQKCFEKVTGNQAKAYGVSGRSVRMDSKLIGSNIASYSRYVLVHKTMLRCLKDADLSVFNPDLRARIEEYLNEDAAKTVYRTDSETMKTNLLVLGETVHAILRPRLIKFCGLRGRRFGAIFAMQVKERSELRD